MYATPHFAQQDESVLRAYVAKHPFAALAINTADGPSVDHIPMEFGVTPDGNERLLGHIARANPLWKAFESGPGLAVFSAHDAYVSPDWYPSKAADPRVLPTWNYASVHVSGTLRFFHDEERIHALLTGLTDRFESTRPTPWRISDAPADFIKKFAMGVVGVELEVNQMTGKWKMSQNRPAKDRAGVIAGLRREGGPDEAALADLMAALPDDAT